MVTPLRKQIITTVQHQPTNSKNSKQHNPDPRKRKRSLPGFHPFSSQRNGSLAQGSSFLNPNHNFTMDEEEGNNTSFASGMGDQGLEQQEENRAALCARDTKPNGEENHAACAWSKYRAARARDTKAQRLRPMKTNFKERSS